MDVFYLQKMLASFSVWIGNNVLRPFWCQSRVCLCQIKAIYFTLTARNLSQIFNSISETSNKSSDLIKAGLTRNNTTSLAKMKIPFSLIATINLRQYLVTTIIAPCLRDSHPFGHDPTEPISQKPTTCSAINLPTLESRTFKFSNLECYILIMAHARKLIAISSLTILLNRASNSLSSRMKLLKKILPMKLKVSLTTTNPIRLSTRTKRLHEKQIVILPLPNSKMTGLDSSIRS